jgi:hypothetical protein
VPKDAHGFSQKLLNHFFGPAAVVPAFAKRRTMNLEQFFGREGFQWDEMWRRCLGTTLGDWILNGLLSN